MTEREARVRRCFEGTFNEGRYELFGELFASDYVDHSPLRPPIPGPAGYAERVRRVKAALDVRLFIHEIFSSADFVFFRWTMTGHHVGTFMDIPPTGREILWPGMNLERFDGDAIVEHWAEYDRLAVVEELRAAS